MSDNLKKRLNQFIDDCKVYHSHEDPGPKNLVIDALEEIEQLEICLAQSKQEIDSLEEYIEYLERMT